MKLRSILLAAVLATAFVPGVSSAAQTSCGGLSPLETSCTSSYRTSTGRPFLDMILPDHFIGSYRLSATSATGSFVQDCDIQPGISGCTLIFTGSFRANQQVFLSGEIRSIRSPLPPFPGEWEARVHD